MTQEQFIKVFNDVVGDQYEHSDLFMDYLQNVDESSTVKEAREFAKILKEFI